MRRSASEKMEIIRIVDGSQLSARQTLQELGINRSTFYGWYKRYQEKGFDGLDDAKPHALRFWNRIPPHVHRLVVDEALKQTQLSPRELAFQITDQKRYFISESSVYRILKAYDLITSPAYEVVSAADSFENPTKRVNEMWQTDFTYLKVTGWGWYYLCTVLDDFSRFILAWKLFTTMAATDVMETLDLALAKTGVDQVKVRHRPRLLSDNGPCYVSKDLKTYLDRRSIRHIRGAPYHPQTQGKIERYHRTMKNVIKLEHHYFPSHLEQAIAGFVENYNHERYHEALNNVTPADVYYGRQHKIISMREKLKRQTLQQRKYENLNQVAA